MSFLSDCHVFPTYMNSVVDASRSCRKLLNTRMWPSLENAERAFSSNCVDNGFELLLVSQFTLFGRVRKIKRFVPAECSIPLFKS